MIEERMIVTYCAKITSTSVRHGSTRWRSTSTMCDTSNPPADPGVDMPPTGNSAGIGPNPTPNRTSRISPSQNVGTDQNPSDTPDETRSRMLPGRHPLRMPSHMPSQMEMIVELPISSKVGQSRCSISVDTGSWNCHE